MKTLTLGFFVGLVICICQGCNNTSLGLDSENIPFASEEEIAILDSTINTLLGIRAFDPVGYRLSTMGQHKGVVVEWTSISYGLIFNAFNKEKQNVGGVLNRYHSYDEGNSSNDINLWMLLLPEYSKYYEAVVAEKNEEWLLPMRLDSNDLSCNGRLFYEPFLIGEIAVQDNFLDNNDLFDRFDDSHCEEGTYLHKLDTFGLYGPIIQDADHGDHPEVHPAQQLWFRDKSATNSSQEAYWLVFFQDASNRLTAWAGSPLHGQFKIAFKIPHNELSINLNTPLTMEIQLVDKEDLVTPNFPEMCEDEDDGRSHTLQVDGKSLVVVNESGYTDEDMGIKFVEVRKLDDGTIQGYVQISMVIGDKETGPHGRAILKLVVKKPQSPIKDDLIRQPEVSPN